MQNTPTQKFSVHMHEMPPTAAHGIAIVPASL